jgi:hypothetical protein
MKTTLASCVLAAACGNCDPNKNVLQWTCFTPKSDTSVAELAATLGANPVRPASRLPIVYSLTVRCLSC